jgi:hypothetical protein
MDSPSIPFRKRTKAVLYSVLLIFWWIGIWGMADTLIHLVFKGHTMMELGVYFFLIASVLTAIFMNPEIIDHM